jgi:uncharacterized protein YjbI with pentapeptide repeats
MKNSYQKDPRGLNYKGKHLTAEKFIHTDLNSANFQGAVLTECDFSLSDLQKANFADSKLYNCKFNKANLQNANFTNAVAQYNTSNDTSSYSSDFTETSIAGTCFKAARLGNANFQFTKGGLRYLWLQCYKALSLLLAILCGVSYGYCGHLISFYFPSIWDPQYNWPFLVADITLTVVLIWNLLCSSIVLLTWGLTLRSLLGIVISVSISGVVSFFVASPAPSVEGILSAGASASGSALVGGGVGSSVVFLSTLSVILSYRCSISDHRLPIFGHQLSTSDLCYCSTVALSSLVGAKNSGLPGLIVSSSISVLGMHFSNIMKERAVEGIYSYKLLNDLVVSVLRVGSTNFSKATLTDADFSEADLSFVNFRGAKLTHVAYGKAEHLEWAFSNDAIWKNSKVRKLLTTHDGSKEDLSTLNLRGANLRGFNLADSILTETQLTGADLTGAILTGACIQSWNIDGETILKEVVCKHVYERQGGGNEHSERRPHRRDFSDGEFEGYYQQFSETLQLLIREGTTSEAVAEALQQIYVQNKVRLSIDDLTSMKHKDGNFLLTFLLSCGIDRAALERTFESSIALHLKSAEEKGRLKGRGEILEGSREILEALKFQASNIVINGDHIMVDQRNQAISAGNNNLINTGELTSTGSITLGNISGSVTNAIGQLSNSPADPDTANIKTILTDLQKAIEDDATLSEEDKIDALEQISKIAKVGTSPQEGTTQKIVRVAIKVLKGTIKDLPTAENLVKVFTKSVPLIASFFGLG